MKRPPRLVPGARRAIADTAAVLVALLYVAATGLILASAHPLPWQLRAGLWLLIAWLPVIAGIGWLAEPGNTEDRRR